MTSRPTRRAIIGAVCRVFAVTPGELTSSGRARPVARPRQVAMFLLRRRGLSLPEVARQMHRRDHTTALHACRVVGHLVRHDEDFADQVERAWSVAVERSAAGREAA